MLLVLEGNIGASKCTLLDVIGENLASCLGQDRVLVLKEPTDKWYQNDFYEARSDTGLQLLLTEAKAMFEMERSAVDLISQDKIVVMERSLTSTQWVFGEMVKENLSVSKADKGSLDMFFHRFPTSLTRDQIGCMKYIRLHLHSPVVKCLKRIRQRGGDGEEHITEEFLRDVEKNLESLVTRRWDHDTDHTVTVAGFYDKDNPMSATVEGSLCGPGLIPTEERLGGFVRELGDILK